MKIAIALGLGVALATPPAPGLAYVVPTVRTNIVHGSTIYPDRGGAPTPGGDGLSLDRTKTSTTDAVGDSYATAHGGTTAYAGFGTLKVGNTAHAYLAATGNPLIYQQETYTYSAFASWADNVTIDLGAPGTSGVATFVLDIDALQSALGGRDNYGGQSVPEVRLAATDGIRNSFFNISYSRNSGQPAADRYQNGGGYSYNNGPVTFFTADTSISGAWTVDIPFSSGRPIELLVSASCAAVASAYARPAEADGSSSSCDMLHTITWGGLSGIRVGDSAWTGPATISSTSTFDYSRAAGGVPEPASWAMLVLGFGLIGVQRRSRRRGSTVAC